VHLINRTVNREFLFGDVEKEYFVELMRRVEAFTGCTVLTFVIMSNHYHILLAENAMPKIDDDALLARMEALYGAEHTTFKEDKEWLLMCREAAWTMRPRNCGRSTWPGCTMWPGSCTA